MMTPMQRGHGHDAQGAQPNHAISRFGREFMFDDQGRQARDQQQGRDAAKAVRTVVMIVMVAVMHVMVMPPMMAMLPAVAVVFVERKFIAHANSKFAHKSPCFCAATIGRKENIIIQSSKVNHSHQIIIIRT
jgi:hypothetical protein